VDPETVDWRGRLALILGGEGGGVPDEITQSCETVVTIPMATRVESLNVAAAGAILVYAARRKRQ
jgi:tRNA G18 (ribose-2'-O)-methylase SpoU